ncbi:Putative NADH-flavin reductase [Thalassobacillus cyri]|uniref:Putative NADH-flavin reductase n=1 Tax=Thalassobacillus cyri TaxID=571932 RepID=A0A1H4GHH9_9BACI|nr:SDR family oxidoreductase [Thalassobacillus cyri]SEB09024.1 Putative NADH-flavin reductase [Thalassobacillus cyri]
MKIAVFGATGRIGSVFTGLAEDSGWEVNALIRNPHKIPPSLRKVNVIEGNASRRSDVEATIKGCDAVFVGLGTDKTDTLSVSAPLITEAMKKYNVIRAVIIGTAGILDSRYQPGKYRFETPESKRKSTAAAEEHLKAYQAWKASGLDWTYICPTYLPDGDVQGDVRFERSYLPENGKKVTVGDTASFAFDTLVQEKFIQQRIGICY